MVQSNKFLTLDKEKEREYGASMFLRPVGDRNPVSVFAAVAAIALFSESAPCNQFFWRTFHGGATLRLQPVSGQRCPSTRTKFRLNPCNFCAPLLEEIA